LVFSAADGGGGGYGGGGYDDRRGGGGCEFSIREIMQARARKRRRGGETVEATLAAGCLV